MLKKRLLHLITGLLLVIVTPLQADELLIVTESLPPYNYKEEGEVRGVSTEVVQAVLEVLGIESQIRVYPWARAYQTALKRPNVLIYSISRTPQREDLFQWVGEVVPNNSYLFKLATRQDIALTTVADAKSYRIGTWREDVSEQYLLSQGFVQGKHLDNKGNPQQNIVKLLKQRLDLTADTELSFYYKVHQLGYEPDLFAKALKLQAISTPLYMAFSRQTATEQVTQFRNALMQIKQQGVYDAILKKYLHHSHD